MAVQAHPSATDEQLATISGAIQTWNDVLVRCFDGLITLTEVERRQDADIVVHYVPTAGGVVFGGYAICGEHGCPNILVRSDLPTSRTATTTTPSTWAGWLEVAVRASHGFLRGEVLRYLRRAGEPARRP